MRAKIKMFCTHNKYNNRSLIFPVPRLLMYNTEIGESMYRRIAITFCCKNLTACKNTIKLFNGYTLPVRSLKLI